MIDEADRDGDGEINLEEFMRIMKKTNLFWPRFYLIISIFNKKKKIGFLHDSHELNFYDQ